MTQASRTMAGSVRSRMVVRSTTTVRELRKKSHAMQLKTPAAWAMVLGATMSDLPTIAGFVTAGHAVLFEDAEATRCDVCAGALVGEEGVGHDDDERSSGRGLLVWSRGEERRYQEPPLCASCATAIGVSALQRWEIEEEEG